MSLKQRLKDFLINNHTRWYPKGHLCDLAREHTGATGESTGRRLREMFEAGELEVKYLKGTNGVLHAHYRIKEKSTKETITRDNQYALAFFESYK